MLRPRPARAPHPDTFLIGICLTCKTPVRVNHYHSAPARPAPGQGDDRRLAACPRCGARVHLSPEPPPPLDFQI